MMKTIIVDASAIMNGFAMPIFESKCITTPSVMDEVQSKKGRKNLQAALDLGQLEQRIPKKEFIDEVLEVIMKTKDTLSKQDTDLIALALEFKASIATDDYGIQNIAAILGLKTIPIFERGIKVILHWQYYCPGCKEKYARPGICGVCGTKLKRKAKKHI